MMQNIAEPALTLEEVLELLDKCDAVLSLDAIEGEPVDLSLASIDATKAKKRVRNPLNDVKRRQRRKAERQQLKEQVQQYEALVERLQRSRQRSPSRASTVGSPARAADSPWLLAVVEEEQRRRRAEQVNAKLKALLAERMQTAGTIRDVLTKEKTLLAEISSTVGPSLPVAPQNLLLSSCMTEDVTSLQLWGIVGTILDSTDAAFGSFASDNIDSPESVSRVKQQDQTGGPCIELLTTTPLACDLKTAKSVLWEAITAGEWPAKQATFSLKTKESSMRSVELRFSMGFEDLEQAQIMLDGATLLTRRDEENRMVLAWTSTIAQQSRQLYFQSQGWIVVMKSPADPQRASLVRTCCRISAINDGSRIVMPPRDAAQEKMLSRKLQNNILRSMGQRVKSRVEDVQQCLADRAGPTGSGALIFV